MATTWNPADKSASLSLSGGNLTAAWASSGSAGTRAIDSVTSGKYYFEGTMTNWNSFQFGIGLASATFAATTGTVVTTRTAGITVNGTFQANLGTLGNVTIGVAFDVGGKLIWLRVAPAGNWNASGTANPGTGVGGINYSAIGAGAVYPILTFGSNPDIMTANFGPGGFSGAVPAGFTAGIPGGVVAGAQGPRVMVLA